MSARPRPRPRPRPAQKASTPTPSTSSNALDRNKELDKEDERFIRNRGRTEQGWAYLMKNKEKPTIVMNSDSDEDDDQNSSPHRKKKQKAKAENTKGWQNGDVRRFLSQEISSGGEDEDVEIIGQSSRAPSTQKDRIPSGAKRKRSRSKSLTPPPEVCEYKVASAKQMVRQAFGVNQLRSNSPELVIESDDDDDLEDLDPELRQIALKAKARASAAPSTIETDSTVQIKVELVPHPLYKPARPQAWLFITKRGDNFRQLFDEVAKMASIQPRSLVLTYQGTRVYPVASPHFLKISAPEAKFDAYDQKTYDYLTQVRARSVSVLDSDQEEHEIDVQPSPSQSDEESEVAGEKFRLILRSSKVPNNITLVVKPTTTCQAIVAAFIKKAGINGDASKARLSVDGDKMDPESAINEIDVEDGDMVEVVGL